MRTFLIIFILITISIAACRKAKFEQNIPECIKITIEANKTKPDWNIKRIDEYEYQGNLVYIFETEDVYPDMMTNVVKSDCTSLCGLGGIGGIIMCNGDKIL